MIREAIDAMVRGRSLPQKAADQVMGEIMDGEATPAQIAAFITALRMKGESVEEIAGMAMAMRERSLKVETQGFLVDTCGTGGDGLGTFNVSTGAAIVAAAAGVTIAKHGNRAASGTTGSADVLEAMGVKIDLAPPGVQWCLEEVGIGFMFAPVFHPAMRHAGPVRREIGIRTVFNILGPLTNPAGAQAQLLGVADKATGDKMARALHLLGCRQALVVNGWNGMDELSLTGRSRVWVVSEKGASGDYPFDPRDYRFRIARLGTIRGGAPAENAAILHRVLRGEKGSVRDVVVLNAAAAIALARGAGGEEGIPRQALQEGIQSAAEAIDSGAARSKLENLVRVSQSLAV